MQTMLAKSVLTQTHSCSHEIKYQTLVDQTFANLVGLIGHILLRVRTVKYVITIIV